MNRTDTIVFQVDEVVKGTGTAAVGRCGDHDIAVGALFTTLCRYAPRQSLDEFNDPPRLIASHPVALRVVSAEAYRHALESLGHGMTGKLGLDGDVTGIESGDILEGPPAH